MGVGAASVHVLDERVLFARDIPPDVNACLQAAVACADDFERARGLLYQARDTEPPHLASDIALYKFLFYRGHLDEAREVVSQTLVRAARLGGFEADWRRLTPASADWGGQGPERAYIYSIKALAFIHLRLGLAAEGRALLDKLAELDPLDRVGGSVIRELAEAV